MPAGCWGLPCRAVAIVHAPASASARCAHGWWSWRMKSALRLAAVVRFTGPRDALQSQTRRANLSRSRSGPATKEAQEADARACTDGDGVGAPNEEWALDFVADALASARSLRILTVVDAFTASVWRWRQTLRWAVCASFASWSASSPNAARHGGSAPIMARSSPVALI